MTTDHLPKHIQNLLYAEEHGLLDDKVGLAVKRTFQLGVADSLMHKMLLDRVEKNKIKQAFLGPICLPKQRQGDFLLGFDLQGKPILCPHQYFNEPSLTVASTGSGKTTKSKFWILQFAVHVVGLWLFDFRKREFAMLKPYLARLGCDLLVVQARQLRLNPLQVPEYCNPRDFAPNLADTFFRVFKLPPVATRLLHQQILYLYQKFGIFEGAKSYPTLFDLRECIAASKKANPQAREAILARLDPVLMSLRDVLCYRYGWTTKELAKRKIAFDFSGVSEDDKDLLLNTLLIDEFMSRIAQGISNPKMNLWICCDEAARLVGSSDTSISEWIGLIRGTGIGLDLSLQQADLARTVLSNTPNKFIGRCASANDYDTIGSAIGLTVDQRRWLAMHLVPGLFLGSLGQGWRKPFLFRIPKIDSKRHGPDLEYLQCQLMKLPSGSTTSRLFLHHW